MPDQPGSVSILTRTQSLHGHDNPNTFSFGIPGAVAGYGYVSTGTARPTQVNPVESDWATGMGGAAAVPVPAVDGNSSTRFNPSTSSSSTFIALQQQVNQAAIMGPPTVLDGTAAGVVMNRTQSAGNYSSNQALSRSSSLVPTAMANTNTGLSSNTAAQYKVNTSAAATMPRIAPVGPLTKPTDSGYSQQQQQSGYAPSLPIPATSTGYGKSSTTASSYSNPTTSSTHTQPPPPQQYNMSSQMKYGSNVLPQGHTQQHPVRIPSSNTHYSAQSTSKPVGVSHQIPTSTMPATVARNNTSGNVTYPSSLQYSSVRPTSTGYASSVTAPVVPASMSSHTAKSAVPTTHSVSRMPPSQPPVDEFEISEEALAQLLALEKAAMGTTVTSPIIPAVQNPPRSSTTAVEPPIIASQNTVAELSEDDLAHLIALTDSVQAQCLSPTAGIQAPIVAASAGLSQCDDFELSEEALAQLMELEQKALAGLETTGQQGSLNVLHISTTTTPTSHTSPPLKCMRLVALDVVDNPAVRVREVRAFQPGVSVNLQSYGASATSTVSISERNMVGAGVVDDMIIVELTGDW